MVLNGLLFFPSLSSVCLAIQARPWLVIAVVIAVIVIFVSVVVAVVVGIIFCALAVVAVVVLVFVAVNEDYVVDVDV